MSLDINTFNFSSITSFGELLSILMNNALVLAGIICLFLLVFGGFGVIMGAGGDPKRLESGKKTVTAAIIGLLIVVASFWILQIIGYVTGTTILKFY